MGGGGVHPHTLTHLTDPQQTGCARQMPYVFFSVTDRPWHPRSDFLRCVSHLSSFILRSCQTAGKARTTLVYRITSFILYILWLFSQRRRGGGLRDAAEHRNKAACVSRGGLRESNTRYVNTCNTILFNSWFTLKFTFTTLLQIASTYQSYMYQQIHFSIIMIHVFKLSEAVYLLPTVLYVK